MLCEGKQEDDDDDLVRTLGSCVLVRVLRALSALRGRVARGWSHFASPGLDVPTRKTIQVVRRMRGVGSCGEGGRQRGAEIMLGLFLVPAMPDTE